MNRLNKVFKILHRHLYTGYFGGASILTKDQYINSNGYSNEFFGDLNLFYEFINKINS
jgi:hypothetical protein